MKLIVGLGNPGSQYSGSRHNIGFAVLDLLAQNGSGTWRSSKFEADVAEILIGNERVMLLKPMTYMNLSGRSVRAATTFYKLSLEDMLVICDDLNLPTGQLRFRATGSAGGQKGLQNIIDQFNSQEICRLRFGIGRPPERVDPANYVLQKFSLSERSIVEQAVIEATLAVETWVKEGPVKTMNRFNGTEPARDKPS